MLVHLGICPRQSHDDSFISETAIWVATGQSLTPFPHLYQKMNFMSNQHTDLTCPTPTLPLDVMSEMWCLCAALTLSWISPKHETATKFLNTRLLLSSLIPQPWPLPEVLTLTLPHRQDTAREQQLSAGTFPAQHSGISEDGRWSFNVPGEAESVCVWMWKALFLHYQLFWGAASEFHVNYFPWNGLFQWSLGQKDEARLGGWRSGVLTWEGISLH